MPSLFPLSSLVFSHTRIWLLVSFSLYFFIFRFFVILCYFVIINFYKNYFIRIGNSLICVDCVWHKYHEWYFEIVISNFHDPLGEWKLRQFRSITSGIYAKYHAQIMLLFVYTTTSKRFVIFTCRHFKLSWNTTALSQSNGRNFSCTIIIIIIFVFLYENYFCFFHVPGCSGMLRVPGFTDAHSKIENESHPVYHELPSAKQMLPLK